jgi:hypothetical protein
VGDICSSTPIERCLDRRCRRYIWAWGLFLNKLSELKRVLRFGKLLQLALADKIFEVRSQHVDVVGLLDLCKLGRGLTTFVGIRTSHHVQSHTVIQ